MKQRPTKKNMEIVKEEFDKIHCELTGKVKKVSMFKIN